MDVFQKQTNRLKKREQKLLNKKSGYIKSKLDPIVGKIENKIPEKLKDTLSVLFYKSFQIVFEKGNRYIEKTYNKDKQQIEHDILDYHIENKKNRKSLSALEQRVFKARFGNRMISAAEGAGLGILGIGMPDIPLFIAVILKNIYQIAMNYGFSYEEEEERLFILSLISSALVFDERKEMFASRTDEIMMDIAESIEPRYQLDDFMKEAAEILAHELLVAKFIQGIPIAGVIGSITNYACLSKIDTYAAIKYKQRYLERKISKQNQGK